MRQGYRLQISAVIIYSFCWHILADDEIPPANIGDDTLFHELKFLRAELDVVQAATKTEIPVSKAPASVTVINYAQIRKSGARTIPELLRMVPGVNVRWNPMMQTIDIRGFGGNPFSSRVLMLIDGIPYNSWNKGGFPQQPGFDFFMLQNIKRLEIIRGPGSVLYGENAFWGVLNIVTLSGEDIEGGKLELYAGDLETINTGGIYGDTFENGSYLISLRQMRGQFPTEFWFDENDSIVTGTDIFLKGKYKDLEVSYYRHEDEVDGFNEPINNPMLPPGSAFKSKDELDQIVDILALRFNHKTDDQRFTVGSDISFARRNGVHCGACHASQQDQPDINKVSDHGSQLFADLRVGIHAIPRNDILIGAEIREVKADDHADELLRDNDPDFPNVKTRSEYSKPAVYIQDQIALIEDELDLVAGLRYDLETHPDLFDDEFSPRLALVYNPSEAWTVRTSWSQAFRRPTFSELYQDTWFFGLNSNPPIPLAIFEPNPNLKQEEIETFDFGIEYRLSQKASLKAEAFYTELDDFIVTVLRPGATPMDPGEYAFENHPGKARILGAELEVRWEWSKRLNGFVNWSYQEQQRDGNDVDSTGKQIEFAYAPQHKINLGIFFRPFTGFSGAIEATWRDRYIAPSFWYAINPEFPTVAPLDDYLYVNLRLNYDLPYFATNGIKRPVKLTFQIVNILNDRPNESLTGVNGTAAGRRYFGGIEYRF